MLSADNFANSLELDQPGKMSGLLQVVLHSDGVSERIMNVSKKADFERNQQKTGIACKITQYVKKLITLKQWNQ